MESKEHVLFLLFGFFIACLPSFHNALWEREKKILFQLFPGSLSTLPQLNQLTIEKYYNLYSKNVHYTVRLLDPIPFRFINVIRSNLSSVIHKDNRGLKKRKLANQIKSNQIFIFAYCFFKDYHLWGWRNNGMKESLVKNASVICRKKLFYLFLLQIFMKHLSPRLILKVEAQHYDPNPLHLIFEISSFELHSWTSAKIQFEMDKKSSSKTKFMK